MHDMCGNVAEWVLYRTDLENISAYETRGGSYYGQHVTSSGHKMWQHSLNGAGNSTALGFRCAHTVSPQSD